MPPKRPADSDMDTRPLPPPSRSASAAHPPAADEGNNKDGGDNAGSDLSASSPGPEVVKPKRARAAPKPKASPRPKAAAKAKAAATKKAAPKAASNAATASKAKASPKPSPAPTTKAKGRSKTTGPTNKKMGAWSREELELLYREMCPKRTGVNWSEVASGIPGRDAKSCSNKASSCHHATTPARRHAGTTAPSLTPTTTQWARMQTKILEAVMGMGE